MYAFVVVMPAGATAVWSHPSRNLLLVLVLLQILPTAVDGVVDGLLRLNRLQPSLWVMMTLMAATLRVLVQPYVGPPCAEPLNRSSRMAGRSTEASTTLSTSP